MGGFENYPNDIMYNMTNNMGRFLRFDSVGGASGDMILAALVSLGVDRDELARQLASVLPDSFELRVEKAAAFGFHGEKMTVVLPDETESAAHEHAHEQAHAHEHHAHGVHGAHGHDHGRHHAHAHVHRSFGDIREMILESGLTEEIKRDAIGIFRLLAEAEGAVHGRPPEEVRFHEVGAADSIIDIVGSAIGFHRLGVESIFVGPLPVGSGTVECAHGLIPVPAPATVELVRRGGLQIAPCPLSCEMLTPTAAAIFAYWPKCDGENYRIVSSAQAFGHRALADRPNLLRAAVCETADSENRSPSETLFVLECNLDDATGEILSNAAFECFAAGALDVWLTPIFMKKGRPAQTLSVLIAPPKRDAMLEVIFRATGSFGVRQTSVARFALERGFETVMTEYGPLRMKIGFWNGQPTAVAPEFDDARRLSAERNLPLLEIFATASAAYRRDRFLENKKTLNKMENNGRHIEPE